ncbi:MAG: methionine gamma-lyase family protein [Clostridiales bacterium]|nr:MAG: methionine gamma-lyase family protein [Clostridiales bacterium]
MSKKQFEEIDKIALYNQEKVLKAFQKNAVQARHFYGTTGYGYDDVGRDTLNRVFSDVFQCEDAIVSPMIMSGTHALTLALFGILRPGDTFLSIAGDLLRHALRRDLRKKISVHLPILTLNLTKST